VPAELDQVFRRMVAKKPDDRFASLAEVVRALEAMPLAPDAPARQPLPPTRPTEQPSPTVNLPTTGATEANQTVAFEMDDVPGPAGTSILLVEPSRTQAVIIRKYLQELGFAEVVAAPSGQKALEIARTSPPQVVLSALHLPDMTGVQLAQQFRGEGNAEAPGFVLISSEAESAGVGTLSKCGKAVLLHKPFTPAQLAEALQLVSGKGQLELPAAAAARERGTLHVLIVDDSTPARLHARRVLEGLGLRQFVEAADGAQAVAAVAREPFDLIVTDFNMPYLDGLGLAAYLKQNPSTAAVPIIMVTTETDPGKLDAVRQLGVTVCDKSFRADEVRGILDAMVGTP
jgi:two-component system chemotaxis response regulator CheY